MAAPAVTLSALSMVAQLTGVPGTANSWYAAQFTPSAGAVYPPPPAANDTRIYDVFSGDLGFLWDDLSGGKLSAFGDTTGFNWKGNFSAVGGGGSSTVDVPSDSLDLTTLTGTQSLFTLSVTSFNVAPRVAGIFLQNGYFAYVSFTSTSTTGGNHLVNCTFICGTGPGGTAYVCHTGDLIKGTDASWGGGLVSGHDYGARGSVIFRSTDTDLSNGYAISSAPGQNSAGIATEVIPSGNAGNTFTAVYRTTLAYTNIVVGAGTFVGTVNSTAHGLVVGQAFRITGDSVVSDGQYQIETVPTADSFTFGFFSVAGGTGSGGTLKPASMSSTNLLSPKSAGSNSTPPTGGIAVPGVGVGGTTRQYLFYQKIIFFGSVNVPWYTSMMGISYSDDGATWTDASASAILGTSSADITTYNGTQTLSVQSGGSAFPSGSGVLEVDTSTGFGYLSFTSRSGNTFSGINYIRGSGSTSGGSCGVRFMCWGNNASFTGLHQQGWPWRPGDGYVYVLTVANGRVGLSTTGTARMMRVPETSMLDKSAYTYWNGSTWVTDSTAATNIFPDNLGVGEPSFYYHPGTGVYVASYLEVLNNYGLFGYNGLVIRTAPSPQGPWSSSVGILPESSIPSGFYGGWIDPWSNVSAGAAPTGPSGLVTTSVSSGNQQSSDFYFLISIVDPYCTFMMKASLAVVRPKIIQTKQAVRRAANR